MSPDTATQERTITKPTITTFKDVPTDVAIDIRYTDLLGTWQHTTYTQHYAAAKEHEGLLFDGSSHRGWQTIEASDMLCYPDHATSFYDPFLKDKTLATICTVHDPITREPYTRDPRHVAKKAEAHLKNLGIADAASFGPEIEFFILDHVNFTADQPHHSSYAVDSDEGWWNTTQTNHNGTKNHGARPAYKQGYFPVPPVDQLQDVRTDMIKELEKLGITVERHHHEVATAGQAEINIHYANLVAMADTVMKHKYVLKNVARRHGKTVTFMPKVLAGDNGSGMHTHFSLWKNGTPLFAGTDYAGLSQAALHAIAGIIKHAASLVAFTNPTLNSYKRLVPGFEAPVKLAYSARNRSAAIRIPIGSDSPNSKRIEIRFPDPLANPYLAFSALLMAALDGIQHQLDPGKPVEKNIYELEDDAVPSTPGSLEEALRNLEKDHDYLLQGGVFTEDLLTAWINHKWKEEIQPARARPTPLEFALYYNA